MDTTFDIAQFVKDHLREFPLHYGCTSGGWPDDTSVKIDVITSQYNKYRVVIWFNEIVSKACSCVGPDNNESYMNRAVFLITFSSDNTYTIVYED